MRHFRNTAVLIVALLSVSIIAGCWQKQEQSAPNNSGSVTTAPPVGATAAPVGTADVAPAAGNVISKVAYSSRVYKDRGESHYAIFLIEGDAPTPRRLTSDEAENTRPVWSPDGNRIAYLSKSPAGTEIYVWSATDGTRRRVTPNPLPDVYPQLFLWPADREIYYATQSSGGNNIQVWATDPDAPNARKCADLARGDIFKLERNGGLLCALDPWDGTVSLSADGGNMACLTNGGMKATCAKIDGTPICEIPLAEISGGRVSLGPWSPACDTFIITQEALSGVEGETPPRIYVADVNTRTLRLLAEGTDATWSADGKNVIYISPQTRVPFNELDRGTINVLNTEIRIVPAAGGQYASLTSRPSINETLSVVAKPAPGNAADFGNIRGGAVAAADAGGQNQMAPLPPGAASPELLGEFDAASGFTAFRSEAGGAVKSVVVGSEVPPSGGKNCEVTVYALNGGKYVQTEKRLGKMSEEEAKYESKQASAAGMGTLTAEQERQTVGTGLADGAEIKFSGEADLLHGEGRERIIIYAVRQAERWQTFLAIYGPQGSGWRQEAAVTLLSGAGGQLHVNAGLKDLDGDGRPELFISQIISLAGGWKENLKIFNLPK